LAGLLIPFMSQTIEKLQKKLNKDPGSLIFSQLAEEHRKEGNLQEAETILKQGLSRHPNYWSARVTLARIYHHHGDIESARSELERVVHAVPDHLLANRLLGELYLAGNLDQDALKCFRVVQMLSPMDHEVASHVKRLETENAPVAVPTRESEPSTVVFPEPASPQSVTAESLPETSAPTVQMRAPDFLEKTDGIARTLSVEMPEPESETQAPVQTVDLSEKLVPTEIIVVPQTSELEQEGETDDEELIVESAEPIIEDSVPAPTSDGVDDLATIAGLLLSQEEETGMESDFQELEPELASSPFEPERIATQDPAHDRTQPIAGSEEEDDADELTTETLAELYLNQGLVDKAVKVYQKLLLNDPGNAQILQRLRELNPDDGALPFEAEREQPEREVLVAQAEVPGQRESLIGNAAPRLAEERRRKINTLETWLTTIRRERD